MIQELIDNKDSVTSDLAKVILNEESVVQTQHMKSGHAREAKCLRALNNATGKNFKKGSFVAKKGLPCLAASPDAVLQRNGRFTHVAEFKEIGE